MPIPVPKPNEEHEDFINRCMANTNMVVEYPHEQRMAICERQWENK